MVHAVIGDDSVKHNAKIRDNWKLENPENSVGAVIYPTTNSLVHTIDNYYPVITKKSTSQNKIGVLKFSIEAFKRNMSKKSIFQRCDST